MSVHIVRRAGVQGTTGGPRVLPMPGLPGAPRRRIGRILLSRGQVNIRQLAHAVALQGSGPGVGAGPTGGERAASGDRPGVRLGTALLRLGYVQPMHLVRALCDQAGIVNFLVFDRFIVKPPLARLIPRSLAHELAVLPLVRLPGADYLIASADQPTGLTVARLRRRLRGPVEAVVVREGDFHRAIEQCYDELDRRGTTPVRLGEILVRDRLVPVEAVQKALAEARRTGRPLGEVLVRRGAIDERVIYLLLARQRGLRLVSARSVVDPREAAPLVARLSRVYVRHNQVLPYRRSGRAVLAVTSDPNLDAGCLAEVLGCRRVICQLACPSELAPLVEETCRLAAV